MRRSPWPLVGAVLVLLALPAAQAGYGEGSRLEADAPVVADGRVDTLLPNGVAGLLSRDPSPLLDLLVEAELANVDYRVVSRECGFAGFAQPCTPAQFASDHAPPEQLRLVDARIEVVKSLTAYKAIVTTDASRALTSDFTQGGELVATTAVSTLLGTNEAPLQTSAFEEGWSSHQANAPSEPVYDLPALGGHVSATGAVVKATGGFQLLLQGVQVRVTGTTDAGDEVERVYATPMPQEGEPYRFLIVEMDEGALRATSAAGFTGYSPPDQQTIVDVRDRASFVNAVGTLVEDGEEREHAGETLTLAGPISLSLVRVVKSGGDGEGGSSARVAFDITNGLRLHSSAADEADPATENVLAAGAAGAGGAALLLGLAYFWPRLKYFVTAAMLPFYTRIERASVLEHEKREEIYGLIQASPGIHAHEIGERAKIGWGTTVYHLKLLEQHQLVVSKKSGRYKRFFVNTGEYTKKKDVYGALRNPTARAVADHILNHPGTSQKQMCQALGIQPSLASWHVEKLEGVQLVKRVKDGRQVRYFAGPAWSELNVRLKPEEVGAETSADDARLAKT